MNKIDYWLDNWLTSFKNKHYNLEYSVSYDEFIVKGEFTVEQLTDIINLIGKVRPNEVSLTKQTLRLWWD